MFLVDVNASACHEVCDQFEVRADVEEPLELLLMASQQMRDGDYSLGRVMSHHILERMWNYIEAFFLKLVVKHRWTPLADRGQRYTLACRHKKSGGYTGASSTTKLVSNSDTRVAPSF